MDLPAADGETARFRASLDAIWPEGEGAAPFRLGLAVSGGPDSLALLLLAQAALPGRIEAATVDHCLRPESAAEAAAVARVCTGLGVPHATLRVDVAAGNVQSEARLARYAALADWVGARGLAALATAHHADDQAETLLMRLTGPAGSRAWPAPAPAGPCPPPLREKRPFRCCGRCSNGAGPNWRPWCERQGWPPPTIRAMPMTGSIACASARRWPKPTGSMPRRSRAAPRISPRPTPRSTGWRTSNGRSCGTQEPMGLRYRPRAPRAVALRVVARIVRELDGQEPRGGVVARLVDMLADRRPASIGELVVRPNAGGWSFAKAPVRAAKRKP